MIVRLPSYGLAQARAAAAMTRTFVLEAGGALEMVSLGGRTLPRYGSAPFVRVGYALWASLVLPMNIFDWQNCVDY